MEIYTLHQTTLNVLIGSYTSKYMVYKAIFQYWCNLLDIVDSDSLKDHTGTYLGNDDTIYDYHVYRYYLDDFYDIDLKQSQTSNSFSIPKTFKLLKEEIERLERENKIDSIVGN